MILLVNRDEYKNILACLTKQLICKEYLVEQDLQLMIHQGVLMFSD
jgi:hypothetical protein